MLFYIPVGPFHSYEDVTIPADGLHHCRVIMTFESGEICMEPRLPCHGTSGFAVSAKSHAHFDTLTYILLYIMQLQFKHDNFKKYENILLRLLEMKYFFTKILIIYVDWTCRPSGNVRTYYFSIFIIRTNYFSIFTFRL